MYLLHKWLRYFSVYQLWILSLKILTEVSLFRVPGKICHNFGANDETISFTKKIILFFSCLGLLFCLRLQSNLSIVDMLYSRHLVIASSLLWNRQNHDHNFIEKPDTFIADNCYSGYIFLTPHETFNPSFSLYSRHHIFFYGNVKIDHYSNFKYLTFDILLYFYI